jgi:hypothetical protein
MCVATSFDFRIPSGRGASSIQSESWRSWRSSSVDAGICGTGQRASGFLPIEEMTPLTYRSVKNLPKIGFGKYIRLEEMGTIGVLRALILEKSIGFFYVCRGIRRLFIKRKILEALLPCWATDPSCRAGSLAALTRASKILLKSSLLNYFIFRSSYIHRKSLLFSRIRARSTPSCTKLF